MISAGCHRERILAESEASCQTQSKDLVAGATSTGDAGNFRVVTRFFDEYETEHLPDPGAKRTMQYPGLPGEHNKRNDSPSDGTLVFSARTWNHEFGEMRNVCPEN